MEERTRRLLLAGVLNEVFRLSNPDNEASFDVTQYVDFIENLFITKKKENKK